MAEAQAPQRQIRVGKYNAEFYKKMAQYRGVNELLIFILDKINFGDIKTILDIGAMDARQSVEFSEIFEDAKIYTFEATPENYQKCLENVAKSENKDRIQVFDVAVSDKDEKIKFYPLSIEEMNKGGNMGIGSMFKLMPEEERKIFPEQNWEQREIEVEGTRIDTWKEKNNIGPIDLVWMDVQGAELHALKGMGESLHNVKAILTEAGTKAYYEGHTLFPEIQAYLAQFGFVHLPESVHIYPNSHDYEVNVAFVNQNFMVRNL